MSTFFIAAASFVGFIIAYNTYGKFLARKIFQIQDSEIAPSVEFCDGTDFVPTNRYVIFGHHFTAIAGTGPIVGPTIAILWGWLPALIWVVFGSVFIGAVHDLTALILSLRNKGRSIGDIAGTVLSPAAKLLFLVLLTFILAIVIAVFGNVIAVTFQSYPQSVMPSVVSIPVAVVLGILTYRYGISLMVSSLAAIIILGITVGLSANYPAFSLYMPSMENIHHSMNPTMLWTWVLFIYCFFASVLPVWLLLQPRDYVNSLILYIALALIVIGLCIVSFTGAADLFGTAPAIRLAEAEKAGAPPLLPFLLITVACGAVSGFHALVCSGTSSKQVASLKDATFVGYGGMLLEAALAVLVILSCTAGIGLGIPNDPSAKAATLTESKAEIVKGRDAWNLRYDKTWGKMNLGEQVGTFIEGGANFIHGVGIPVRFGQGVIAILIACFAATTIDAALRLMRYILQELGGTIHIAPLKNKYVATAVGLGMAVALALCKASPDAPYGTGGLILWPLFGAGNQVVAGLTLLVGTVYLLRRKVKAWYLMLPAVVMIIIPIWAMLYNIFLPKSGFLAKGQTMLTVIGICIVLLAGWLVVESYRAIRKMTELDGK
ncbi:carbon starvation protein A [Planctomycetales bacterium]|nr:carbon starvation protein A [Planctomycetales bacterium]GHT36043.1 carbon starvation protein A [Planctomycetales bacterium]